AAARSLGRYRSNRNTTGTPASVRVLAALEKALSDSSLLVVRDAAESLGGMGSPEVAPMLANLLRHPSPLVREAAAHPLEQTSNARVLTDLSEALNDPATSDSMRFSIVGARGKVGKDGNPAPWQKADLLKRLHSVLARDPDPGVRSRAAAILGALATPAELA